MSDLEKLRLEASEFEMQAKIPKAINKPQ